jgi:hypothetical protein
MSIQREQNSLDEARAEQGDNPVESGIAAPQMADLFEEALTAWRGSTKVSFDVLRSLCGLSRQHPGRAAKGFTALEIRDELTRLRRGWLSGSDSDAISKRIRQEFQSLKDDLSGKREHLVELAHRKGVTGFPDVDRTKGGGAGNVTRYFLCMRESGEIVRPDIPEQGSLLTGSAIHYVCEDSRERAGLARFLNPFSGRRSGRFLFVGIGLVALLVGLVLVLLWFLVFQFGRGDADTVKALVMIACLVGLLIWATRPVFLVLRAKIVSAPVWLQSDDDDRLIEWRSPPRWPAKSVHLVRYSGECPLCHGRVLVQQRRWFVPDELVGRCEDSPRAHVYSFDHLLRVGRRIENL